MDHLFRSFTTISYWRHFILSKDTYKSFFAVVGAIWTSLRAADYTNNSLEFKDNWQIFIAINLLALVITFLIKRPVSSISLNLPDEDVCIEVLVADIFKISGEKFISTNTTFDTNISNGLISPNSLQGQFSKKFYPNNMNSLDKEIEKVLKNEKYTIRENAPGKKLEYEIGTIAQINTYGERYYFVAMARLADKGNALSDLKKVQKAIKSFWTHINEYGELGNVVIPLVGTERGRIKVKRKKMIEYIAQSFKDAIKESTFSNKLIIVIKPEDYYKYHLNLFETRDYLKQALT